MSIVKMAYYKIINDKKKWKSVLDNYILLKFKKYCPELNEKLLFQKIYL